MTKENLTGFTASMLVDKAIGQSPKLAIPKLKMASKMFTIEGRHAEAKNAFQLMAEAKLKLNQ